MNLGFYQNQYKYFEAKSQNRQLIKPVKNKNMQGENREDKNNQEEEIIKKVQEDFSNILVSKQSERVAEEKKLSLDHLSTVEKTVKITHRINELYGFNQGYMKNDSYTNRMVKVVKEGSSNGLFTQREKGIQKHRESIMSIREKVEKTAEKLDSEKRLQAVEWEEIAYRMGGLGKRVDYSM